MPKKPSGIDPKSFITFGDLLHYLRERAHLSQRELAARVGYHFSFISYLEKNTRSLGEAPLLGRFVPALGIEDDPEWVDRLNELSKTRKEDLPLRAQTTRGAIDQKGKYYLPISLNPIIGRELEIAKLKKLIVNPENKLTSLLGPPGVGKTRIALRLAELMTPFFSGYVAFIDLTSTHTISALYSTIALTLGVADTSNVPIKDAVLANLVGKKIFLILDNFEQIADGAAELLPLLDGNLDIKLLVTSRETLRLRGEHEFHVAPLTLPDTAKDLELEQLESIPAVALFVDRTQMVQPEFRINEKNFLSVIDICSRLDGLPLAIELAAARSRSLSLEMMLEQLDRRFDWLTQGTRDVPAWRRSLKGAFEWSYELLTEKERVLFNRLSVFQNSWTLSAAEEVCADENLCTSPEVLDLLMQLVDKSLIVPENEEGRYSFLESLREFANEKLVEEGAFELFHERHARYFASACNKIDATRLRGNDQIEWLNKIEKEYANLIAALKWFGEHPVYASAAIGYVTSLQVYWSIRGFIGEARYWVEKIADFEDIPSMKRAKLLRFLGIKVAFYGDFVSAKIRLEEALRISMILGDEYNIQSSNEVLGMLAGMQGDYRTAVPLLEQVANYRRACNDLVSLPIALNNLSIGLRNIGEMEKARAYYEEAIKITTSEKNYKTLSHSLTGLAEICSHQKDYLKALALHKESYAYRISLQDRQGLCSNLEAISGVLLSLGNFMLSVMFASASVRLRDEIGVPIVKGFQTDWDAHIAKLKSNELSDQFYAFWEEGQRLSQEQLNKLVETL